MIRALVVSLAAAALLASPAAAALASSPDARIVYHLQDHRIDEASGIAASIRNPGIDYVENDSGDTHRFFALDARTGATAAVVTVPHSVNVDWEDLQVAPDASGTPCVWIADIGDNGADRREVDVYRVPEPRIARSARDVAVTSARPQVWRLRYPDGPANAESLAVTPRGRAYVVTKSPLGVSVVYELPARPDASRVRALQRVATVRFAARNSSSPFGRAGSVLATSASISRDGRLLAIRTYAYALVWRLHPGKAGDGVAAALHTLPTRITLPSQPQGEGIAVTGNRMLIDSEGVGTPVWSVPLPASLLADRTSTAASASSTPPGTRSPTRRAPSTSHHFSGLSIVILALLVGGLVVLGRRARRFGQR